MDARWIVGGDRILEDIMSMEMSICEVHRTRGAGPWTARLELSESDTELHHDIAAANGGPFLIYRQAQGSHMAHAGKTYLPHSALELLFSKTS